MKSTKELLRQKKEGAPWTKHEMSSFVEGMVTERVSQPQIAAFLMAACTRGLTVQETAALTLAMANSGAHIVRGLSQQPRIDKHSTGGVGDKVSLLLAPLAVACGLSVPMISGRGLGHTGGTLDKLESVRGFRTGLSIEEMESFLQHHNLFMAGQTHELVPADRIMYALRDVTGTVENVGLITASILSKKIVEGLDGLVMDMKVGRAAFMNTLGEACALAESMQAVCSEVGLPVTFVFSRMDAPIGMTIGNWLEIEEAELALATSAEKGLQEITIELVAQMVLLGKVATSIADARNTVAGVWKSKMAHSVFHQMIARQGGSWNESVAYYSTLIPAEIVAETVGYIGVVDARSLDLATIDAGAGRFVESDFIDHAAGVRLLHSAGSEVRSGDTIALAYASDDTKRDVLAAQLHSIVKITAAPVVQEPSLVIDIWS